MMDRRTFVGGLGGAAIAASLPSHAQQKAPLPMIGFLNTGSPETFEHLFTAFLRGLGEGGFTAGQSVVIEQRWARGDMGRLSDMAADLVRLTPAVLVSTGGAPAAMAARHATDTVPTLFITSDPVALGLVDQIARPGGNRTGVNLFNLELAAKRVQLLAESVPGMSKLALLTNPRIRQLRDNAEVLLRATGEQLVGKVLVLEASTPAEIEAAFATIARERPGGLILNNDPFFFTHRALVIELAAGQRLPAVYDQREFVEAGGLMSYGSRLEDSYHQIGVYAARILKGAKPGDLPVVQPTRYHLVVNLKSAKALGLDLPPSILLRADEVLE